LKPEPERWLGWHRGRATSNCGSLGTAVGSIPAGVAEQRRGTAVRGPGAPLGPRSSGRRVGLGPADVPLASLAGRGELARRSRCRDRTGAQAPGPQSSRGSGCGEMRESDGAVPRTTVVVSLRSSVGDRTGRRGRRPRPAGGSEAHLARGAGGADAGAPARDGSGPRK
jgi:hypothetical protein